MSKCGGAVLLGCVVLASPNEGKGSCDRVSPFCVCNLQDRVVSGSPLGFPT